MPEEVLNIEQLLQDYVRERDAMVQRSAQGRPLNPDRVLAAVRETRAFRAPAANREAMIELLNAYYPALYAYLRRVGYKSANASELVEYFAAFILDQNLVARFQAERGKFRTFLLTVLRRFMTTQPEQQLPMRSTQWMRLEAADRGGLASSGEIASAEAAYERQWFLTILNRAMTRLAQESAAANKTELFENLKDYLANEPEGGYAPLASKLGMQPNAVAVLVSRLRSRFRNLIRQEIAQTVSDRDAIDEEIRHFHSVLGQQLYP